MTAEHVIFPEPDSQIVSIDSKLRQIEATFRRLQALPITVTLLRSEYEQVCQEAARVHLPGEDVMIAAINIGLEVWDEARSGSNIILVSPEGRARRFVVKIPPTNVTSIRR